MPVARLLLDNNLRQEKIEFGGLVHVSDDESYDFEPRVAYIKKLLPKEDMETLEEILSQNPEWAAYIDIDAMLLNSKPPPMSDERAKRIWAGVLALVEKKEREDKKG